MCGHHAQNLFVLRSPQLSGPWRSCGHGSVQTIHGLLASRQRAPPPLCRLLIQVAKIVWPIFVSFKQVTNTVQYIFNKFCINTQSVTTKVSSINRDTREKGKEQGWMKGIGEGRDGG